MLEIIFIFFGFIFLIILIMGLVLYAKPFFNNLGNNMLSNDDKVEFYHALNHAKDDSSLLLDRLQKAELIDDELRSLINKKINHVLTPEEIDVSQQDNLRHLYTMALRIELKELGNLKRIGLISFYTYYDIKNTLRKARDNWLNSTDKPFLDEDSDQDTFFRTVESSIVRFLREKNWASNILSKYQYKRLSARVRRNIAGALMSKTVLNELDSLKDDYEPEQLKQVESVYEKRFLRRKQRIDDILSEYPEFYLRFETCLLAEIALVTAKNNANTAFDEGIIGSKVNSLIEKKVIDTINDLPKVEQPATKISVSSLIGKVPLLNGLPEPIIEKLADKVTVLQFLKDDVVIGEGEHGDALYIIHSGQINVYKNDEENSIAELYSGNFIGEKALLGEAVRSATAIAAVSSTLLRLSRSEVLDLATEEPELKRRLEEVSTVR